MGFVPNLQSSAKIEGLLRYGYVRNMRLPLMNINGLVRFTIIYFADILEMCGCNRTANSRVQGRVAPHPNVNPRQPARLRGRGIQAMAPPTYNADTAVWGASLWRILHTMAEYSDKSSVFSLWNNLLHLLNTYIPCDQCRQHFSSYLQNNPVDVSDRGALSLWMFTLHNDVNGRLGKPQLDYSSLSGILFGTRESLLTDLLPIIPTLSASFPQEVVDTLLAIVNELVRP